MHVARLVCHLRCQEYNLTVTTAGDQVTLHTGVGIPLTIFHLLILIFPYFPSSYRNSSSLIVRMATMTTSRQLDDWKVARFEKNITKRGAVSEMTAKKGKDYLISPILLGFFIFVLCFRSSKQLRVEAWPKLSLQLLRDYIINGLIIIIMSVSVYFLFYFLLASRRNQLIYKNVS